MNKKKPEDNLESESALMVLDSLLKDSGHKTISENQILIILDALASSDDTDVVARFPAVLAICARRGLALNSQALFSRYWETSPKRQNLEKLLLVSAAIFDRQGLKAPKNLDKIVSSLKPKHGDLLPGGEFQLSSGFIRLRRLQKFRTTQNPEPLTQNPEPSLYISIQFPCKISLVRIIYEYYYPLVSTFLNE